jgi:hypothetical protein
MGSAASTSAQGVVEELAVQLPVGVPLSAIRGSVDAAMADLRGSISAEALPEMAFRLACFRLVGAAPVGDKAHRSGSRMYLNGGTALNGPSPSTSSPSIAASDEDPSLRAATRRRSAPHQHPTPQGAA